MIGFLFAGPSARSWDKPPTPQVLDVLTASLKHAQSAPHTCPAQLKLEGQHGQHHGQDCFYIRWAADHHGAMQEVVCLFISYIIAFSAACIPHNWMDIDLPLHPGPYAGHAGRPPVRVAPCQHQLRGNVHWAALFAETTKSANGRPTSPSEFVSIWGSRP